MLRQLRSNVGILHQALKASCGSVGRASNMECQWLPAAAAAVVATQTAACLDQPWHAAMGQHQRPTFGSWLAAGCQPGHRLGVDQQQHHRQQQQQQRTAAGSTGTPAAGPWHQWQQRRGLLGVVVHTNYQHHNTKRPPKYKIKSPSIARRRILVGEDGVMWRMQAGRRHKRYKKGRRRLLGLKGMVPLHHADAAKLRKLGYKRSWWHGLKA